MHILVTGAAGFIGMHTVLALLARGDTVTGVDNLNDYYSVQLKHDRLEQIKKHDAQEQFSFIKLDIADRAAIEDLFSHNVFDELLLIWQLRRACVIP